MIARGVRKFSVWQTKHKEILNQFPYKFGQHKSYPRPEISAEKEENCLQWQQLFHEENKSDFNLKESFCFAYKTLLESIRDRDDVKLGQLCEKNLYREFHDTSFELHN